MASAGYSRRWRRRSLSHICLTLAALGAGAAAQAQCKSVNVAAAPLDRALVSLARQIGVDIASTEGNLESVRGNAVSGCLSPARALDRLTRGTGYRAEPTGNGSYRLVRAPERRRPPAPPLPTEHTDPALDIVVTGTKQQVQLLRFPGSVHVLTGDLLPSGGDRTISTDELARMTPVMQKTELGVGRNKIFIRGISDSSFNGPTQSTATIYFGDVQLNYSGSEPALSLADMDRVEILEGPQETLYGSGAISGIVRLTPRGPDLNNYAASAVAGGTFTRGGDPGYDSALMANVPIARDTVGLRLVGYRQRDGGYIEDERRGLSNVNRTDTIGGRASLRVEPGDGWSIDAGLLGQRIEAADAGYADRVVGPLARRAFLAEPYGSGISLGRAVIRKSWDSGLQMVSATGIVETEARDTFDATRAFAAQIPLLYEVETSGLLISHETRFSRASEKGLSWVLGASLLYDRDAQNRVIGQPANPIEIIGVTNITRSAAVFGEGTLPLSRSLSVTLGGRASIARTQGEPSIRPREAPAESGFLLRRIEPAIGISWLFAPRLALFGRFQSGYRTGGIAVARGIGRIANFRPDSIRVGELGLRMVRRGALGLSFSTAASYAHWSEIQADLFSRRSQPYTDNIGDAEIFAVETAGDWVPIAGLRADFSMLWTENRTRGVLAGTSPAHNRRLPDTPPFSGALGLRYQFQPARDHGLELGARLRYVGRSVLGAGDFLDVSQGDYTTIGLSGGWRWRNLQATLEVENLTNDNGVQFAMGNPLTFGFREQTVPLRPRSVRVGLGVSF